MRKFKQNIKNSDYWNISHIKWSNELTGSVIVSDVTVNCAAFPKLNHQD